MRALSIEPLLIANQQVESGVLSGVVDTLGTGNINLLVHGDVVICAAAVANYALWRMPLLISVSSDHSKTIKLT